MKHIICTFLGSIFKLCYIQNCVIMYSVIKRFVCTWFYIPSLHIFPLIHQCMKLHWMHSLYYFSSNIKKGTRLLIGSCSCFLVEGSDGYEFYQLFINLFNFSFSWFHGLSVVDNFAMLNELQHAKRALTICTNSEGSGEPVQIHALIWTVAVCKHNKQVLKPQKGNQRSWSSECLSMHCEWSKFNYKWSTLFIWWSSDFIGCLPLLGEIWMSDFWGNFF